MSTTSSEGAFPSLSIKNFGPVRDANLRIRDFICLIGPQASGKSTIAKLLFFFKSLRPEMVRVALEPSQRVSSDKYLALFKTKVKDRFKEYFGDVHSHNFGISFSFNVNDVLKIESTGKKLSLSFSPTLEQKMLGFFEKRSLLGTLESMSILNPLASEQGWAILQQLTTDANAVFADTTNPVFVPAGRSIISLFADQFASIDRGGFDYCTAAFLSRINQSRSYFSKALSGLVQDKREKTGGMLPEELLTLALPLMNSILKGNYKHSTVDGDVFQFGESEFVKMLFASSGQQEALWILLISFVSIINRENVFVAFEEPEAHLFPDAQKEIVEVLALVLNSASSQLVVTTHSPYILSAINNLIYAGKIGTIRPEEAAKIIPREMWLLPGRAGAFYLSNGVVEDLIDDESGLIRLELIDRVTMKLNSDFESLLALDVL